MGVMGVFEMTTPICPYCNQKMKEEKSVGANLTARQYTVFKAVLDAGPAGIDTKELTDLYKAGREEGTLRSVIHVINNKINPLKLAGKRGRYTLDRVKWSMEGLDGSDDKKGVDHAGS